MLIIILIYFQFIFRNLRNLVWLTLNGNLLHTLDSESFLGLDSLEFLDLSNNNLKFHSLTVEPQKISESTLVSSNETLTLTVEMLSPFAGLVTLKTLDLVSNKIDRLFPMFDDLTSMITLNMSGNSIAEWSVRLFKNTTSLTKLDLSYNNIQTLTTAMVDDFHSENLTIYLTGNEFLCTCELKPFTDVNLDKRCPNYENYKCSNLGNVVTISAYLQDPECSPVTPPPIESSNILIFCSVVVSCVILVAAFVIKR